MTPNTFNRGCLGKIQPYLPMTVCLLLGILASILSVYFSLDAVGYRVTVFAPVLSKTWISLMADIGIFNEWLFQFLVFVFAKHLGFTVSMLLMTVFFLTLKLQYLGKITNQFYMGVFFYTCFYLFLLEGTVARVGFATALVMVAFYYLQVGQYWKSLIWVLLSSQIHLSSILFMLIFPIYFIPRASWVIAVLFFTSPLVVVFDISIFSLLINWIGIINSKYLVYDKPVYLVGQNSTGLFFPFVIFFSVFVISIYWFLKKTISTNKFLQTMLLTCMSGISFMWIFYDHVAVAARIGELLLIPIVILLCSLVLELKKKELHLQRLAVYATSLAYGIARVYYLYLR